MHDSTVTTKTDGTAVRRLVEMSIPQTPPYPPAPEAARYHLPKDDQPMPDQTEHAL